MSALGLLTTFGLTREQTGPPPTAARLIQSHPSGTSVNSGAQVGWRFTVGATPLTAVRALSGVDAGTEVVRVWRVSDQSLMGSVTVIVPGGGVSGEADFASPILLAANTSYVVTTRRSDGTGRAWRLFTKGLVTTDARVTAEAAHAANADTYPGQDSSTNLYGIVDLFVT